MLSAQTRKIIAELADEMAGLFTPPELIAGCEVLAIGDKDQYAGNNGWIEARVGQHNRQRCRWRGQFNNIQVGDFVDVLFFASYRLFVVFGQGGTGAAAGPMAHNLLSANHPDTLADSVVDGDIIFGNATPAWARLAKGADGQVLTLASGLPAWADGGGGGWPFDNERTIDPTNPNADDTTLAASIAAAAVGDLLTAGITSYAEALTINKNITVSGRSNNRTFITQPLAITGVSAELQDIWVFVSSTGAHAITANSICSLTRVKAFHGSVADARAIICTSATMTLHGVIASTIGSTTSRALEITGGTVLVDEECDFDAGGAGTAFDVFCDAGCTVRLNGPILRNGTLGGTGTITGWYRDAEGNVYTIDTTGRNTGVWQIDESATLKIKRASLAAALTAAAASGDVIRLDADTYSITSQQLLSKSVTIQGDGPEATIIDCNLAAAALAVDTDNVTVVFKDLTIDHSGGAGLLTGPIYNGNAGVKIILDNAIVKRSGGGPTTGYGVLMDDGTLELRNGSKILTTSGTSQYGIYNVTNAITVIVEAGCEIGGATADVYGTVAGSTLNFNGAKLTNNLISWAGTLGGRWLNANGVLYAPESNDTFSPQTFRPGYIIVPSVASNNLTVALKTLDSNDASAASPIVVRIGDVARTITAALSVTKNAGTNWCNAGGAELATKDVDYFVYLIQETGASAGTKIGFSRIPWAKTMGDFTNTTTNEKYIAGSWTNFNSTDEVEVIGRFNAILSATAAFNWSLTTAVVINRPIYETRFLTWVPTISAAAGTITTVGTVTASYAIIGREFHGLIAIGITTNGTGATALRNTLPFTPSGNLVWPGRCASVSGKTVAGFGSTTTMSWVNYDNSYPMANGETLIGGGFYRIG